MVFLSKRTFSTLLRSRSHLRNDATSANPEGVKSLHSRAGNAILWRNSQLCPFRCLSSGSGNDDKVSSFDRKFFVQQWVSDLKKLKAIKKRYVEDAVDNDRDDVVDSQSLAVEQPQPPVSQAMSGPLKPKTSDEVKLANLLARSNLLITRDIEWANLVLGIEQENRYCVVDVCYPKAPVGSIRETSNLFARQLLRTRRPFVASITDASGNELFRVRRPFWWATSSIYAEIDGEEIGVVHRRWHLWRRIYDLYLGNDQFAVVENPGLWNWTFIVKDADGDVLAQIDRDWRGFGFEIFTDAGQYVIRFGKSDAASKTGPAKTIEELEVKRSLTLSERAVALALAISLDNDYFSRHGGIGLPIMAMGE